MKGLFLICVASLFAACVTGQYSPRSPSSPTSPYSTRGPGSMTGDPVFVGFDQQQFDFFGKEGHSYSVLSSSNLTVNIEMVAAGPEYLGHEDGVEGTFVGGLSVLLSSFELYAHVDVAGNMTIYVNGLELDIELPARFNSGLLTYEPYVEGVGQVITIQQQPFKLAFKAVKQLTDAVTGFSRGHFELQADIVSPAASGMKGILGATLGLAPGKQAPHDAALYEVSSLSQKADGNFLNPIVATSRRLLYK